MSETLDIYLRAHTVLLDEPKRKLRDTNHPRADLRKWPEFALVFDCESRTDVSQALTFGFYRLLKLEGTVYVLEEEGAFFNDDLPKRERKILEAYVHSAVPDHPPSLPPRFPLHSRSGFVRTTFYRYARKGALIVGFNICYDLARLATKWSPGDENEWSLVLSEYPDGNENLNHPRVLIEPLDSRKAFIRFRAEWVPKQGKAKPTDINKAGFLDLRTLLWAEFHKSMSLKSACELKAFKKHDLPQKDDYAPTGQVSVAEIEYGRQDVRCTVALLNAAKQEFDLHPTNRRPDKIYSPGSFVKSYFDQMGIIPPAEKFKVPDEILGIAMESYTGGRSEARIRNVELPVAPVDFTSEYPTICVLMELMKVLTAKDVSFEDATADVQKLLEKVTLKKCFDPNLWPDLRFFALVKPKGDVLPVRTMYNGFTQNVGNNYLSDDKLIWVAGPDLINSAIQNHGKIPRIERALRLVPHGKQPGLRPVRLRGAVRIDPRRDDLFRKVIEERKRHESDKELYHWLKIFANSIYGCFVEINPETLPREKSVRVRVYSGEESFIPNKRNQFIEREGLWYSPYLGSLITAGGRLLLGMLEKCVSERGGVYAWADTDALGIVSSTEGGALSGVPGCKNSRILPRTEVQEIIDRFAGLNPYGFGGSILRFTEDNYINSDPKNAFRQLLAFVISAKRYATYERHGDQITIIRPKAHGLGYLYPPADSPKGWDDDHELPKWVYEAWEYILRKVLRLRPGEPAWLRRPQMMRMVVTTNSLLRRMHRWKRFRPYNFFLVPILAHGGYPADIDPDKFTLVTPFEKDQRKWLDSVCINLEDSRGKKRYRLTTSFESDVYGERAVVATFEALLNDYLRHPESKSLAPNGEPCRRETVGLLQRAHIIGGKHRRIGKEVDRRWEEGDDLDAIRQRPIEYLAIRAKSGDATAIPGGALSRLVKKIGLRKLMRQGLGRRILQKIWRQEPVKISTLREYERAIRQFTSTTRRRKSARL
jgi:hypothetical protein